MGVVGEGYGYRFTSNVHETRAITVTYEIEAETTEKASEKARDGETVDEEPHPSTVEILHRTPVGQPEEITEEKEGGIDGR